MAFSTLLLIDDHPLFRRGLAGMFSSSGDFEVVGEASSGREGIELARRLLPSVILLDLHMPGLSGLQVLDEIKQLELGCRVIALTAALDRTELLEALHLGVDGYALKEMDPDALLAYVRQCSTGSVVLNDQMVSLLSDPALQSRAPMAASEVELTVREAQTLALIARGMSNKLIAREFGISDGTVKIYVKSLLRKLKLRSRLELAAWVYLSAQPAPTGNPYAADAESRHAG
ncbi:response regulator (plasmid) [Cupriavidus metallidurans]|uniref:response regulator n=1 Tax=Cupriavidus metallidurans TaxID=119219 RepID=UPI003D711A26